MHDGGDNSSMASVFAAKSALRKSMMRTLRSMSDAEVERQSQHVADLILHSSQYRNARSLGCYLHMPHAELRTDRIINAALKDGKKLFIPYLPPPLPPSPNLPSKGTGGEMKMLRLYSREDLDKCKLDKWSLVDPTERRQDLDEPREDAIDAEPMDLILIPGVAFDQHCNRLGRGKAFYDSFLDSYCKAKRKSPTLIALALAPQMLPTGETIPFTLSDFQLDGVATPDGITWRPSGENAI